MELSRKARKITERCLVIVLLALLGWAAWSQYTSVLVRRLATYSQDPVEVTVLTSPAMFISYTPATHQARVRVLGDSAKTKNPHEKIKKLLSAQQISPQYPVKFFEPAQTAREPFWEDFKTSLLSWRYNPVLAARTAWAYLTAWHSRRTNLSPAEFALLALALTKLEPNDFTVRFPAKPTKKKQQPSPEPLPQERTPLTAQDRPIIVEVLNASGRKGLALELTQFLREQNTKGLLRVDVLQYDNYPSTQPTSWIENYSGRQIQLKQLGNAIGITGEIHAGNTPNVICDTRIILGQDFKMPL